MQGDGWLEPLKPQALWELSAKPFSRKSEGGAGLAVADCVVSDPLFLRSGHGQVTMLLWISTRWMLFSVACESPPNECYSLFWQERARSPGTAFPLRGPVLAKRRWAQLVAPSGPGPHSLPSCHHWGSQVPRTQRALRLLRPPKQAGRGRSCRLHAMQAAATIRSRRQGWGRGSLPPQGLGPAGGCPWWGLWNPAGHSLWPAPWAP